VRLELQQGNVTEISFLSGRHSDVRAGREATPLPAGALRLYDLGFFDTRVMAADIERGVHWISRVSPGICLRRSDAEETVEPQEISAWLQKQTSDEVDCQVALGKETPLHCRLIAVRCPEEVRQRRLRKLEKKACKDGRRPVSERQRIMAGWLVLITDLPANELSIDEAWVLYRTRWQIELLFKLWKSHGGVHQWRGKKPDRVLCEIFAKLLATLAKHWLMLLAGPWLDGKGALAKARRVRRRLGRLLAALPNAAAAEKVLHEICAAFERLKRRTRRKKPLTIDLLKEPAGAELRLS
jgi:Transposase DDE domain